MMATTMCRPQWFFRSKRLEDLLMIHRNAMISHKLTLIQRAPVEMVKTVVSFDFCKGR